jgi:hypothetical protein
MSTTVPLVPRKSIVRQLTVLQFPARLECLAAIRACKKLHGSYSYCKSVDCVPDISKSGEGKVISSRRARGTKPRASSLHDRLRQLASLRPSLTPRLVPSVSSLRLFSPSLLSLQHTFISTATSRFDKITHFPALRRFLGVDQHDVYSNMDPVQYAYYTQYLANHPEAAARSCSSGHV